jgi:SOS-response transcriptional repressor LexA
MNALRPIDLAALKAIDDSVKQRGRSPLMRELADALGRASTGSAHTVCDRLMVGGYLTWEDTRTASRHARAGSHRLTERGRIALAAWKPERAQHGFAAPEAIGLVLGLSSLAILLASWVFLASRGVSEWMAERSTAAEAAQLALDCVDLAEAMSAQLTTCRDVLATTREQQQACTCWVPSSVGVP